MLIPSTPCFSVQHFNNSMKSLVPIMLYLRMRPGDHLYHDDNKLQDGICAGVATRGKRCGVCGANLACVHRHTSHLHRHLSKYKFRFQNNLRCFLIFFGSGGWGGKGPINFLSCTTSKKFFI